MLQGQKGKTTDQQTLRRSEGMRLVIEKLLKMAFLAIPSNYSGDVDRLDEMVKSMMEKSQSNYANGLQKADRCKVCGKEGKGNAIKDHIEANHIEGIVLPCNLCEKSFRSRNALRIHNRHRC